MGLMLLGNFWRFLGVDDGGKQSRSKMVKVMVKSDGKKYQHF